MVSSEFVNCLSVIVLMRLNSSFAKFLIFKICKTIFLKLLEPARPLFCDMLIRLFFVIILSFPNLESDIESDFIFFIFPLCLKIYVYTSSIFALSSNDFLHINFVI